MGNSRYQVYSRRWRSIVVLVWIAAASAPALAPASDAEVDFNRDIRPIFAAHCAACHSGVKQVADLSFVYPEQVLPPDGWVVEPGDPDASILIERVESDDDDLRMPPADHGPPLSEHEVDLLRNWIAQGATWRQPWAFEKPIDSPLPQVTDNDWPRTPMDRFILARLEREGLAPSPPAAPYRWLRRVSLDLVGFPPTPAELQQFQEELQASGESAYAEAVDRLLDSERYGERWASVWLDQVRYADSMGLGLDGPRTIWKYRDWVIRALNDDMPYDQFTIKQIAGDLLPDPSPADLIATACQRLTQTNEEGGTDDEEFRVAAVLDRVNTTWQAWEGLTFGCVQCHSHPYDPIRHEEYYEFAAFYNNTADSDLGSDEPVYQSPIDPKDDPLAAELDSQIDALRDSIWRQEYELASEEGAWTPLTHVEASTDTSTKLAIEPHAGREEFRTVGTVENNTTITLEAPLPSELQRLTAIRVTGMPLNPEQAVDDSEWGFVWSNVELELIHPADGKAEPLPIALVVGDEPRPFYDPQESLNTESKEGFGPYSRIHYPRSAALILATPVSAPAGARIRVRLAHQVYILSAFGLVTNRGYVEVSGDERFTELLTASELQQSRGQLATLQIERKAIPSVPTPIMRERPAQFPRPMHVFQRGLFLDKGELVTPDVPESFPPLGGDELHTRMDLAKWLVSPDNPLTARVAVNRFWARLFGVGLVESEEDFGSSGEPPSHPELLDHLAIRFQSEFGWSMKSLLREIVLSSTYRQSSAVNPELLARDSSNRLLARGPRHRLPAEAIRDQALAISGLLNSQLYGPPVRPPIPEGVWKPFTASDKWPKSERGDPDRYRRSIYTYTKRSIPYPMFASFDEPSREFCTSRRLRSNTPLQALELLNSEVLVECGEALSQRMREASDSVDEQIAHGFLLALSRPPTDREIEVMRSLYDRRGGDTGLQAVAVALLNLDEFLTK